MTKNTLKITFKESELHRTAASERLRRAKAGDDGDGIEQDVKFILNFEEYGEIERLMRTVNLELIEAIVAERPDSIRQLAAIVERDYREVHRNLQELNELGVLEFESDGQRKRPLLRSGAEQIDFSVRFPQQLERADEGETVG